MSDDLTDRITDALDGTTPGPWVHVLPPQDGTIHRIEHQLGPGSPRLAQMEDTGYSERSSWDRRGRDAALIAAAPSLLAEARDEITRLREGIATHRIGEGDTDG